jgi:uncharacterized membrane protein (UPF0127 family)
MNPGDLTEPVLADVESADGFFKRLTGLVLRKEIRDSEGLLFEDCSGIHSLWMRFSLDVIFLDGNNRILKVIHDLKPFRFTPLIKKAVKVLELKAGISSRLGIRAGCYLKLMD